MRLYNGDCKEDMFELFYLVTHLIAWFLVPLGNKIDKKEPDHKEEHEHSIDEQFTRDLKTMIKYMCTGLEKLQNTYKNGNVVLTIQYYINMLEDGLKGSFDIKRLPQCLVEDLWIDSPLKNKISDLWDYERLHRVCSIFEDCFAESEKPSKIKTDLINGYLLSIENILGTYEKEFNSHIKQWV